VQRTKESTTFQGFKTQNADYSSCGPFSGLNMRPLCKRQLLCKTCKIVSV